MRGSLYLGLSTAAMSRRAVGAVCLVGSAMILAACSTPKPMVSSRMARYDLGPSAALPMPQGAAASGVQTPAPTSVPATPSPGRPLLKLSPVAASASLDDDRIRYRLDYADIREARTYANSRWAGTPSQLLTERLRERLAPRAEMLQGGDPERAPQLRIELIDFSQRFVSARHGVGVVSVRASLRAPWPDAVTTDGGDAANSGGASDKAAVGASRTQPARTGLAATLRGAMMGTSTHGGAANQWIAQREFTVSVVCPTPDAAGAAAAIADASDRLAGELGNWVITALQAHPTAREQVQ